MADLCDIISKVTLTQNLLQFATLLGTVVIVPYLYFKFIIIFVKY